MAVNSSSSSNDSFLHANRPLVMYCLFTRPSSFIFTAFTITHILFFLPLFILVLYMGVQRWRQQRSTSSAAGMSHSDSFTYHMTSIELIGVLGCILWCFSVYLDQVSIFYVGNYLRTLNWYGQVFFHMLTCVERYLAVVHPVTYLSLKGERGIRIRNISIGCVWLLCFGSTVWEISVNSLLFGLCLLIFTLVIVLFCSLSVVCVLIRPGPGVQGGARERVDQSKRRAFYTIMAILGVLSLRCFVGLFYAVLYELMKIEDCGFSTVEDCLNIPSSLVLPLLFLHRAGRLACCKDNT